MEEHAFPNRRAVGGARSAWFIAPRLIGALACASALLTALPTRTAAQEEPGTPPPPNERGSHEAYREALNDARGEKYQALLAIYDDWLANNPEASAAAVERCRFILGEETEEVSADDSCVEELVERFPRDGAVYRLQIERLWGDEAIALALATMERNGVTWSDRDIAEFFSTTAWAYSAKGRQAQATGWARLARKAANVDVDLILAGHYRIRGQREQAIAEVMRESGSDNLYSRLSLLIELAAFQEALELIARRSDQETAIDPMLHARALEGVGRTDEARELYNSVASQPWQRTAVLRRLLYIDIANKDRTRAIASYDALRAQGFDADPLLRYRLAVAVAFPTVGWQWRDLLGALALFGCCLLCIVLPTLWVVPVHYVSMLRRERGKVLDPAGRWSLRHLWAISTWTLLAGGIATYLFEYESLHAFFYSMVPATPQDRSDLARSLVSQVFAGCVVMAIALRRGDYERLIRSDWGYRKTAAMVLLSLFAVGCVGVLTRLAERAYTVEAPDAAWIGATVTTKEMVLAVLQQYGPWVMFPLIAILVPIYEEVVFRSVVLGSVARHVPFGWANFLQASAFAAAHDDATHIPQLLVLGLIAGVFVRRSGGLAPAIALHATVNTIAGIVFVVSSSGAVPEAGSQHFGPEHLSESARRQFATARFSEVARACDTGNAAACEVVGAWPHKRVAEHLAENCANGAHDACRYLGNLHLAGTEVPRDVPKAAALFQQACNGGDAEGCVNFDAIRSELDSR